MRWLVATIFIIALALLFTLLILSRDGVSSQKCFDQRVITPQLIGSALAIGASDYKNVSLVACPNEWCLAVRDAFVSEFKRRGGSVEALLWKGEELPKKSFIAIGNESFVNSLAQRRRILLATAPAPKSRTLTFSSGIPVADWRRECVSDDWLSRHNIFDAPSGELPGFRISDYDTLQRSDFHTSSP